MVLRETCSIQNLSKNPKSQLPALYLKQLDKWLESAGEIPSPYYGIPSFHDPGLEFLPSFILYLSSSNLTLSEPPMPNWISIPYCFTPPHLGSCCSSYPEFSLYIAFLINQHLPSNLSSSESFPLFTSSTMLPVTELIMPPRFLHPACSWPLYVFLWLYVFVYIPPIPCLFLISFPCFISMPGM